MSFLCVFLFPCFPSCVFRLSPILSALSSSCRRYIFVVSRFSLIQGCRCLCKVFEIPIPRPSLVGNVLNGAREECIFPFPCFPYCVLRLPRILSALSSSCRRYIFVVSGFSLIQGCGCPCKVFEIPIPRPSLVGNGLNGARGVQD